MNASVTVDTRQFDAALKQYLVTTSKTLAKAINDKAGGVAFGAYSETPKTDEARLMTKLNAVRVQLIGKRGKPIKRTAIAVGEPAMARTLFVAELRRTGKLSSIRDVKSKVADFVRARIRSIGFFRSGWIPAIRALSVGAPFEKRKGRPVGRALKAKDELSPVAEIENNATPKDKNRIVSVSAFMGQALQKAFKKETADMEQYLARKAQAAANTVNASTTTT